MGNLKINEIIGASKSEIIKRVEKE